MESRKLHVELLQQPQFMQMFFQHLVWIGRLLGKGIGIRLVLLTI
jgi:hypothetical protein